MCLQHKDLGWRTLEPPALFCNKGSVAEPGVIPKKQLSSPGLKPLQLTKVVFLLGRVREAQDVFQEGGSFQIQTTPPDPPDVSPLLSALPQRLRRNSHILGAQLQGLLEVVHFGCCRQDALSQL